MSFIKHLITGPAQVDTSSIKSNAFKLNDYLKNENSIQGNSNAVQNQAATQINQAPQNQYRDQQMTLASTLANQMNGNAPSAAQMQLNQGRENNIKAAMAMSGSQPQAQAGSNAMNLARTIMTSNQGANRDASMLRANESANQASTLANVLGQGRSQDIGLATSQGQLTAQEQAQKNQMVQQYLAMGISLDQAQSQADMDLERLKLGINQSNANATNQQTNAMVGGLAGVGAALATGGGGAAAPAQATQSGSNGFYNGNVA